jgi:hypothetical protein
MRGAGLVEMIKNSGRWEDQMERERYRRVGQREDTSQPANSFDQVPWSQIPSRELRPRFFALAEALLWGERHLA